MKYDISPETLNAIKESDEPSTKLGARLNLPPEYVRQLRRKMGIRRSSGRQPLTLADFPGTNWRLPTNRLAGDLGISWTVCDRLRAEALRTEGFCPTVPVQFELPGMADGGMIPAKYAHVDWTQNTSVLCDYLRLDRAEVLRLKSLATRQRSRERRR